MRGVHPVEIAAFGSLPMAIRTEQMDVSPASAAANSMDDPSDFSEPSKEASLFLQGSWSTFSRHPPEPHSVTIDSQIRRAIFAASCGCPLARAFAVLTSTHTADRNRSLDEAVEVESAVSPPG